MQNDNTVMHIRPMIKDALIFKKQQKTKTR
jgi:hypothetical protein